MTEQKQDKKRTTEKQKRNHMTAIIRRIFLAVIGLILGGCIYFANAQNIIGNQLPMPFGIGIANVLSGSMEPVFSKGTLLIVKESGQIEKGDIVVYQSGSSLVVHRIINIEGNKITTKGDANNASDPVFDRSLIRGKVIGQIPHLGTILTMVRTPAGVLILILCAVFLIENSFRKQKEEDDRELESIKAEIRRLKQEKKDTQK